LLQKPLTFISQFPQEKEVLAKICDVSKSKRMVKAHLKQLQKLQADLFKISGTNIKFKPIDDDQPWENLNSNFESMVPYFEETISRWSQRAGKQVDILGQVKQNINAKSI
jgi:bisphosphoglycerate-dependent phosphoglycerate mutase